MVRTNTPIAALVFLSSVCDGASSHDKTGFSGADVEFGHDLARKGQQYGLSPKQHAAAQKLAHKYRRQLAAAGFDPAAIAADTGVGGRPTAAQAPRPGYVPPAKPLNAWSNRFAAHCGCGAHVPVNAGKCNKEGSRWVTYCAPCSDPLLREVPAIVARHGEGNTAQMILMARRITEDRTMSAASHADAVAFLAQHGEPVVHLRVVGPNGEALPAG